jgi:hypothetical protein
MANVYATKSGNWSDTTVWNTGSLPTSADDVYANTFTVTVDVTATVLTINNTAASGISAGGRFQPSNGANLTCTATATISPSTLFINSTLISGQSATFNLSNITISNSGNYDVIINTSSGTLNLNFLSVILNTGGFTGRSLILNQSSGTINLVAAINNGSNSASNSAPVINSSSGIINITGLISGSAASRSVYNTGGGTINITGNAQGGSAGIGIENSSTGTINITGTCTGGSSTGNAFVNSSTGTINHIGTAQASPTAPAIGVGAAGQITNLTGPLLSTDETYAGGAAASGVNPCAALRWFPLDTALSTFEYRMRGQTLSGSPSIRPARRLYLTDAYAATYPSASNVRTSTTYGPGNIYTGTCTVPPAGSVLFGVPTDNTVGTVSVTITPTELRDALGLASANLDSQLTTVNSNTAAVPASVRSELSPELARALNAATTQEVGDIVDNAL